MIRTVKIFLLGMREFRDGVTTSFDPPEMDNDDDDNEFELSVDIPVSLDEAETIQACLAADGEEHLAEHVKYCIKRAKEKAGYLQPAKG